MCFDFVGGGGGYANSVLDLGGSCKFRTDLGGGSHEFCAGLAPVFRPPPQHIYFTHIFLKAYFIHMYIVVNRVIAQLRSPNGAVGFNRAMVSYLARYTCTCRAEHLPDQRSLPM